MAPDVKIRNLDEVTYARLKSRSDESGISMEAILRAIVADALGGDGVTMADWENSGFEEVDEIAPGRLYEVRISKRCFRIAVTRSVTFGVTPWNSSIDERVRAEIVVNGAPAEYDVWTSATQVADRLVGETEEMALRDAMRWLAAYVGVDVMMHARLREILTKEAHPALADFYVRLSEMLVGEATFAWLNKDTFRVDTPHFTYNLARLVDSVVITTFWAGTNVVAEGEKQMPLVTDASSRVAAMMRERERKENEK